MLIIMLSLKVVVLHFARGPWNETVNVQLVPQGDTDAIMFLDINAPLVVARSGLFMYLVQNLDQDKR
jgi:hypothetical protein